MFFKWKFHKKHKNFKTNFGFSFQKRAFSPLFIKYSNITSARIFRTHSLLKIMTNILLQVLISYIKISNFFVKYLLLLKKKKKKLKILYKKKKERKITDCVL